MIYATPRTSVRKWLRSSGQLILDRSFTHLPLVFVSVLRSHTGALLDCSLRSRRCSLVAAVFVGSGET